MPIEDQHYLVDWGYTHKFENENRRIKYEGRAKPGTPTDKPGWQIRFFEYDGDGLILSITWANSDAKFNKVWDDRIGYIYG